MRWWWTSSRHSPVTPGAKLDRAWIRGGVAIACPEGLQRRGGHTPGAELRLSRLRRLPRRREVVRAREEPTSQPIADRGLTAVELVGELLNSEVTCPAR